jgi:signal transduction histidine kinase
MRLFSRRQPLGLPITLGIVMILLVIVLIVGWVILAVVGAVQVHWPAGVYWTVLSVGATFLGLVLVGVVIYLALSIKAINLNRRQSNFIDSVTHELKSPIASLKLYLQTISRRQLRPEEYASFCRYMLDDVERLDRLINHVLDAAKIDDGKSVDNASVEDLAVSQLVRDCADAVSALYRLEPDAMRFDLEPCSVRAARVDLEMIVRNLVDNAAKYAGSPPHIEITVRHRPPDRVILRIADNGSGIPRKLRRKIFGRFVRLGLELERRRTGTGLGLYIVRNLVHRLKGQIRVRDPVWGPGTVFEVELPGRRDASPTPGDDSPISANDSIGDSHAAAAPAETTTPVPTP